MTLYHVEFLPDGRQIPCAPGSVLHKVAHKAGIPLASLCGGIGRCGKCKVKIERGMIESPTAAEHQKLSVAEIESGYRLACQTSVQDNLTVYVPPLVTSHEQQIDLSAERLGESFEPVINDVVISLQSLLHENHCTFLAQLATEINHAHGINVTVADPAIMGAVQTLLNECQTTLRAFIRNGELIALALPDDTPLGIAIDLGTTTIAAYLLDLATGQPCAAEGMVNPQVVFGEDVMSRITYAMEHGSSQLHEAIINGLNQIIKSLCPSAGKITEIAIAGNTAMHHLLLNLPVRQLGVAPYEPAITAPLDIKARDLGLAIAPGAYVHVCPNVAGFIGGDHVAMILASSIHETAQTVIGVDIGTNTEIVLSHEGILRSTSCASGPAFEGGHIACGMRAVPGAIEKICIRDSAVHFQTIGGKPPLGICGSGILDAVAEFFKCGTITHQGKIADSPLVRSEGKNKELVLVPRDKSATGKAITITQQDITEVQLAKAAIRTGIEALLAEAAININNIDEIILTGEFGIHINPASGIAIGMFPPIALDRFRTIVNAAGLGAMRILRCKKQRALAGEIAKRIKYLELMTYPDFHKRFANALYIPSR